MFLFFFCTFAEHDSFGQVSILLGLGSSFIFISCSNVQMQNTDLVFVDSLLSAVNGLPKSGVWGTPGRALDDVLREQLENQGVRRVLFV